jgi:hypothetical protein
MGEQEATFQKELSKANDELSKAKMELARAQSEASQVSARESLLDAQEKLESIKLSALIKLSSLQRRSVEGGAKPERQDSQTVDENLDLFWKDTTEHQVIAGTCAEKVKSWWYHESSTGLPIRVLSEPSTSKMTDKRIRAKLLVGISEETLDDNGDRFLKLADGGGWLHSSLVARFKKWEVDQEDSFFLGSGEADACSSQSAEQVADDLFTKGFTVQHLLVMAQVRQWGHLKLQ